MGRYGRHLDSREDPTAPVRGFLAKTFRVLKEKEEQRSGEYRTGNLVSEAQERIGRARSLVVIEQGKG